MAAHEMWKPNPLQTTHVLLYKDLWVREMNCSDQRRAPSGGFIGAADSLPGVGLMQLLQSSQSFSQMFHRTRLFLGAAGGNEPARVDPRQRSRF